MRLLAMSVVLNHAFLPHSFAILPTSVFATLGRLRNVFDETIYMPFMHLDSMTLVRRAFFMNPGV